MKQSFNWQWLAVALIFVGAIIYLIRTFRNKNAAPGCGGGSCGCVPGEKPGHAQS